MPRRCRQPCRERACDIPSPLQRHKVGLATADGNFVLWWGMIMAGGVLMSAPILVLYSRGPGLHHRRPLR